MGLQLYKSVFIILTVKREVPVDDPLNVNRELWRKLVHFELVDKVQSGASAGLETRSEFRIGAILQVLDELFLIDGHNKTASATSELFLNSALGRVLISKLHTLEGSSLLLHATNLLLKGLKAAKSHNRLQAEQNFYLNYSVVLLKHYVLGIGPAGRLQKFMSSEAIDLLVENNPLCLNLITRVVPKHIQRKLRASVNAKAVTSWRAPEWLNTLDLVNLELQKIDSGDACVSKLLIDRVKNYFSDFGKNWVKLPQALVEKIFQNVLHHKASTLADIAKLVQIRHNFEEFDLEYSKSLNRLLVGRYFLTDLYVPSMANPTLLADIENPETFYQELTNFYINQKEIKNKSECLKVICLVLCKYPQEKMKLIPYFVNEFNTTEDLAHQYYLMQYFSALISTNETYTRYNNLVEFLKNDGLALTFKTLQKSLMENVSDNVDLAGFVPNFSGLPLPRPATTKNQIRANTALVCLKILSNVRFFERAATGQIILETRMVPESRTAKFFSDPDTLNLLVQLLLSKESSVVEATLQVIHAAYDNQSLIFKLVSINTAWERLFSAGLRPGFAAQVSSILCHFTKTLQAENEKYDRELKDLLRLIPEYILFMMLKSSGPEVEFIFTEGQEVISAEAYWTNDMYSELKRVITQLFILDLQQLDDFYTGRKKAFPRVRAPPVKVQLSYEIPKELLSVDGVFINSLVEKGRYDFKDEKLVKNSLLERCLNLAEKRVTSKEFQSYDALAISDLRLSVQVILRFIYAERVSDPKVFTNLGRLGVLVSQEWSKNATRLSVRGPQINYNVTNSLLDLIRCLCLHFDKKQSTPETVAASFEIVSTIVKKLLKKLQLGLGRLTYIDFKLLKSSIKLQGKVLASEDEETLGYIKRLLQDPEQDFDIHLVHCLRLLNKNLDLFVQLDPKQHQVKLRAPLQELEARPVEELVQAPAHPQPAPLEAEPAHAVVPADAQAAAVPVPGPAPAQPESSAKQASTAFAKIISKIKNVRLQELEIKRQKLRDAMTAEQKAHAETLAQLKAQTVKEISQYEGLQEDLKVIGWNEEMEILESQQADVDLLTFDAVIQREELEHEVRSHFLKFNAYLLDLLKRYFEITEVLPTMVINGVGYTLLQLLFSVYLSNQTRDDLRLIRIAAEYGTLFRKVLSLSCEAVISHYGQDFTTLEATLRGPHSNVLTEKLEKIDREHQVPLVEFFRVIRKNFMWEFVTKSIGNYGAFVHWANQRANTEAFFNWLSSQGEVKQPTFIWSVAYARELHALLGKQTDAILISRKVNYSHVLDSHQSPYLANFTRIGDLFLETLVQTHDYQFHEPQKLLRNVISFDPSCPSSATHGF